MDFLFLLLSLIISCCNEIDYIACVFNIRIQLQLLYLSKGYLFTYSTFCSIHFIQTTFSGSNTLLQNSISNTHNNSHHHQLINNNHSKQTNLGLSNHHHSAHHHHALSAAALSSPFSSLLGAGSSAGYLLDPLGGLSKPTAANHLF